MLTNMLNLAEATTNIVAHFDDFRP